MSVRLSTGIAFVIAGAGQLISAAAKIAVCGGLRLPTGCLIRHHSLGPLAPNVTPQTIFSLRRTGMRVVTAMTAEHVLRSVSPPAPPRAGLATVLLAQAAG